MTSENFMNDFIDSLRDKRIDSFKQRYRHYDVLLVDDLQFFEGKERIQEEFFHTFNALFEAGSQVVLSSDRPPRELATLEPRLRSRFEWGLITDIQPPDLETRIAILRKKVHTEGIHVPDPQVLTFIASLISSNIRELEGALTRVVAFSSLTGRLMTVELAQEVLKDVFPPEAAVVNIHHIQEEVADRFGLSLTELCSDRRSQNIVYPRQVAMYLSRELTDSSLPKIGKNFGGRDHTTVIHATSKIARLIKRRPLCLQPSPRTHRAYQAGALSCGFSLSVCEHLQHCFGKRCPLFVLFIFLLPRRLPQVKLSSGARFVLISSVSHRLYYDYEEIN